MHLVVEQLVVRVLTCKMLLNKKIHHLPGRTHDLAR